MKKRSVSRFSKPKAKKGGIVESWHNGADAEIHLYSRALQKAARALVQTWDQPAEASGRKDFGPTIQ